MRKGECTYDCCIFPFCRRAFADREPTYLLGLSMFRRVLLPDHVLEREVRLTLVTLPFSILLA